MKLLDRIFATPESIEKTVDAAISAGDKIWYTSEEEADDRIKLKEWYLRYLEATAGHNLARRFIALIITGVWALLIVVATVAYPFNAAYSEHTTELLKTTVLQPHSIVMAFYFMKQIVDSYRGPKK